MTVREHYSHAKADAQKARRHKEADERAAARARRSNKQQLAKLDAGGYTAKRERAKLEV